MVTLDDIRTELEKKLQIDHLLRTIEVRADTLDEALADAAVQLETKISYLEYEVIERGSDGFLGIAKKPWVINVYESSQGVLESQRKKAQQSESVSESVDSGPVVLDKDGEFFIHYFDGKVMLKVLPPVGNGKPVTAKQIMQEIKTGDTYTINEDTVKKYATNETGGVYEEVGTFIQNPVNDAVFTVDVSSDEMTCTILATAPMKDGGEISPEYIERQVKKRGILHGINYEKIE